MIRLGLIGDNIKPSHAPKLHREAGRLAGLDVSYELLIPAEMGMDFDRVFENCRVSGMRGLNITYPYKQIAVAKAEIDDPLVRRLGAINTVVFENGRTRGYNTDHSGFIAAYRATFGEADPGHTVIVGAGGAGSAVAFALAALGARELTIVDKDIAKAKALARALGEFNVKVVARSAVDATCRDGRGYCQLHADRNGRLSGVADRRCPFSALSAGPSRQSIPRGRPNSAGQPWRQA